MKTRIRAFFANTATDAIVSNRTVPLSPVTAYWEYVFTWDLHHFGYSERESRDTFRELVAYLPSDDDFWQMDPGEAAEIVCSGYYERIPKLFARRWLILRSFFLLVVCATLLYFII